MALVAYIGSSLLGNSHNLFAQSRTTPLSTETSLEQIELAPGYQVELLAAEPLVVDPVDVAFDNAGRMWVVEMRDYPFRISKEPQGRIRVLSDRDGDGVYDHAHLFADGLEMPTGLAVWKDGVVVTLAGQLIFMRDTDGDFTADEKQIWLEGFAEDNEQLRANHPRLELDGKWTIATGLRGGNIQLGADLHSSVATPQPMAIGSRDVRFDPRSSEIELITGPAQFGLCFDPFGNRYFCSNRNPAVKVIFEQEQLSGNPLAGLLASVLDVLPAGEASQVYPLIESWTTSNLHAGQFTAACGVFVRLAPDGSHSGDGISTEIFVCEPTGSLVKRATVQHHTKYEFSNIDNTSEQRREWLASRDAWFRPVNIAHTPVGGVAIVDMHRAVIEHPDWVPEELKNRPDERWGDDCGRIFSVHRAKGSLRAQELALFRSLDQLPLDKRTDEQLAQHVVLGNPWFQENAARLLIERHAVDVAPELRRLAFDRTLPLAGRVVALKLAATLQGIQGNNLLPLLAGDDAVELQIVALQVIGADRTLHLSHVDAVLRLLENLQPRESNAAELGFEAWLALGEIAAKSPDCLQTSPTLLDQAARFGARDPYQLVAVAGALRSQPGELLKGWMACLAEETSSTVVDRFQEVQIAPLARGLAVAELKGQDKPEALVLELVKLFAQGAPRTQIAAIAALEQVVIQHSDIALRHIDDAVWERLQAIASEETSSMALRQVAVDLLSRSPRRVDSEFFGELTKAAGDPQSKALYLKAWAAQGDNECDRVLIELLTTGSPALQATSLKLIAERPVRIQLLADQLTSGQLSAQQLGALELKNLISRSSGANLERLQQAYDGLVNSDRHQVVERYRDCLDLSGDALRGQLVFQRQCASCHQIGGIGVQVGPDISDSRIQQPLQLLTSILNPNLAIDNNYFRYVILTKDDEIIEGMVAEETADAIVIRSSENRRTVVPREEVAQFKATGVSMMPDGLEAQIDPQAMADLIAFIKGWRYLDGAIPGK